MRPNKVQSENAAFAQGHNFRRFGFRLGNPFLVTGIAHGSTSRVVNPENGYVVTSLNAMIEGSLDFVS